MVDLTSMKIHQVPIGDLVPAEYNPRRWTDDARAGLTKSLKKYGFTQPIVVNSHPDRKNIIIGGNFKHSIAKDLDLKTLPVVYVELDEKAEHELNVRLNKNGGEFDNDLLAQYFSEDLLKEIGFNEKELDNIFQDIGDEDDFNAQEEYDEIKEPDSKLGDIWQLGGHRLMCGDATVRADIDALMDGKKADMVFTDPPYNVNYTGGTKKWEGIKNDKHTTEEFVQFLSQTMMSYKHLCKPAAALYCCYSSSMHREFQGAIESAQYKIISQIIWVKKVANFGGWGDSRWKHEPMFYCKQPGEGTEFHGDRKQTTAWDEELSDSELLAMIKKQIVKDENGESTVWRLGRETNYDHPTQKPLKLLKIAIRNSSKRGDLVVDLFAGSGSALISADKNNRQCFTMELDPKYVDVIRKRWMEHSDGIEPILLHRREQA